MMIDEDQYDDIDQYARVLARTEQLYQELQDRVAQAIDEIDGVPEGLRRTFSSYEFVNAKVLKRIRDVLLTCHSQHPFNLTTYCALEPGHEDEYHRNNGDAWRPFTAEEVARLDVSVDPGVVFFADGEEDPADAVTDRGTVPR